MKTNINSIAITRLSKKLIKVFDSYGISLKTKDRNLHLKNDLQMDEVFINGLIFELELASNKHLDKDFHELELRPAQLIREFAS